MEFNKKNFDYRMSSSGWGPAKHPYGFILFLSEVAFDVASRNHPDNNF